MGSNSINETCDVETRAWLCGMEVKNEFSFLKLYELSQLFPFIFEFLKKGKKPGWRDVSSG